MKRPLLIAMCLVALAAFSLACGGGGGTDTGASPSPTVSTSPSTAPTSTPPPEPLSIFWTEPNKKIVATAGERVFLNFRGEGTHDSTAVITIGRDTDTNYDNGGITWFDRTFPGGYFLVTVSMTDYTPGTYYFVAKISRAGETLYRYLDHPLEVRAAPTVSLTAPAGDVVAAWGTDYPFTGANNSASANVFIGLDTDRNPTNGYSAILDITPGAGDFTAVWTVLDSFNGRYYPFINVHETAYEEYSYAPGSLLIGDLPSVTFVSPLNPVTVHPLPPVRLNIKGDSTSTDPDALFRIGYDTDTDPDNGGITWIFDDLDAGPFDLAWDIDIREGGTYHIIGQVIDRYGAVTTYAPGAITVDNSPYIEFYEPIADVTIIAGRFLPLAIRGWAYSSKDDGVVTVFYDTDTNLANGFTPIADPFPEGGIDLLLDVSELLPGTYHIGATMVSSAGAPMTAWAPMTLNVLPNTDVSDPANSGPYFSRTATYFQWDSDRNKTVSWIVYYPTDSADSSAVSSAGPFPVVVFMPEEGSAATEYTYFNEKLAHWGYIVAAINTAANFGSSSANRARKDAADASYVLDWLIAQSADSSSIFHNAVDDAMVGAAGHGRGAGAAIIFASLDDRVDAVFAMAAPRYYPKPTEDDPHPRPYKAGVPVMILSASLDGIIPPSTQDRVYGDQDPFKELATIEGANHYQFKDTIQSWENDTEPTMLHIEVKRRVQILGVSFLNSFVRQQTYYMKWVNGEGVSDLRFITIKYQEN